MTLPTAGARCNFYINFGDENYSDVVNALALPAGSRGVSLALQREAKCNPL
jgi:hypothetical protein